MTGSNPSLDIMKIFTYISIFFKSLTWVEILMIVASIALTVAIVLPAIGKCRCADQTPGHKFRCFFGFD